MRGMSRWEEKMTCYGQLLIGFENYCCYLFIYHFACENEVAVLKYMQPIKVYFVTSAPPKPVTLRHEAVGFQGKILF